MVIPRLLALGQAVPEPIGQLELWHDWFERCHPDPAAVAGLWAKAGVTTRHAVADPRREDLSHASTGERMQRYVPEALPLARDALDAALATAGIAPSDIEQLTVVSCTGYATPGLDILLAREMGLAADLQRLTIGHMGCYAAIPALATVTDAVRARGVTSALVCVELPSLHVQPPSPDLEQVVAHALFGDAAAAAVLAPSGPGLGVVDVVAHTETDHHRSITWDITDLGFRMGLSPRVPAALARHVGPVVDVLLARHGLRRDQVRAWALHPGGPRILDVCAEHLGLDESAMEPSRRTLDRYGNCSSATVLLVLDELRDHVEIHDGDHVVVVAFGPGLTVYAALLRQEGGGASTR